MSRIGEWLSERVPISGAQLEELTNEPVPYHLKRWWFCLGGTPAYLFVVQIVTGILLAFYYQPSPRRLTIRFAYITEQAKLRLVLPQHAQMGGDFHDRRRDLAPDASLFHGAYRRPREINWLIGMCLLMCTLLVGFTGYSLAFEQLSYWGATVAANISDAVPMAGRFAKQMLLGGDSYNERTLSRFYILHAAVLPTTMILLIGVHITFIRLHGVTEFHTEDEADDRHRVLQFLPGSLTHRVHHRIGVDDHAERHGDDLCRP